MWVPTTVLLLGASVAVLCRASGAVPPIADQYTQFLPSQFVPAAVAEWGVLPAALVAAPLQQAVGVRLGFVAADAMGGLWLVTPPVAAPDSSIAQAAGFAPLNGSVAAPALLLFGGNGPHDFFVVDGTNQVLGCQLSGAAGEVTSACAPVGPALPPTAAVQGADAMVVPSGLAVAVASAEGLFVLSGGGSAWQHVPLSRNMMAGKDAAQSVVCVGCAGPWGACFATSKQSYTSPNAPDADLVHVVNVTAAGAAESHFYRVPGIISGTPTATVYDPATDAVVFVQPLAADVLDAFGTFTRLGGFDGGLPQQNVSTAAVSLINDPVAGPTAALWLGSTTAGAMLRLLPLAAPAPPLGGVTKTAAWKYFYGPRWMPDTAFGRGNAIVATAATPGPAPVALFLAASGGLLFVVANTQASLAAKAAAAEPIVRERHWRDGCVNDCEMTAFGDLRTCVPQPGANDGLWTSMYIISQVFRYAVTKDPAAQANALGAFRGLQMLTAVTGTPGYPARSFRNATAGQAPPNGWHVSPSMPGMIYNGDTSSDEITGHLDATPLMAVLLDLEAADHAAVVAHADAILSYIVANNFTLVDPTTGRPTTWGHWDPASVNGNPFFYDERGVNALQMLAFLAGGHRITGDDRYADAFRALAAPYGYLENMINLKITQVTDINYSDDELTYVPLVALAVALLPPVGTPALSPLAAEALPALRLALDRTTRIVLGEQSALWNSAFVIVRAIIADMEALLGVAPSAVPPSVEAALIAGTAQCLRTMPPSYVAWPFNNALRLDQVINQNPDRAGQSNSLTRTLFPYDEITISRWNANPFRTRDGSGFSEPDPSVFLTPYWMSRFAGLVAAPQNNAN